MSVLSEQRKNELTERLRESLSAARHADGATKQRVEILTARLSDLNASGGGVRKSTFLREARGNVLPAAADAFASVPWIAQTIQRAEVLTAFDDLDALSLFTGRVGKAVDAWWIALERGELSNLPAGIQTDPEHLTMVQATSDLMAEVGYCIHAWPSTTTSVEGRRTRDDTRGQSLCELCHRPSQRFQREHEKDVPGIGLVVSTGQQNTLLPRQRGSAKFCDQHTKGDGRREQNAGRYSSANEHSVHRGRVRLALMNSEVPVPRSARLVAQVAWMSQMQRLGNRELKRRKAAFDDLQPRLQVIVESLLRGLPGFPQVRVDEELLELVVSRNGWIKRQSAVGEPVWEHVSERYDDWNAALDALLLHVRRKFGLGEEAF